MRDRGRGSLPRRPEVASDVEGAPICMTEKCPCSGEEEDACFFLYHAGRSQSMAVGFLSASSSSSFETEEAKTGES